MKTNAGPYHCVMVIMELDREAYSLYFSVEEGCDRAQLFELVKEAEVLRLAKELGAKVVGYTIEKRVELSDDGLNRTLEILEKSNFDGELIPIQGEHDQPENYISDCGPWVSLHKNNQELQVLNGKRMLHVTRKEAEKSIRRK